MVHRCGVVSGLWWGVSAVGSIHSGGGKDWDCQLWSSVFSGERLRGRVCNGECLCVCSGKCPQWGVFAVGSVFGGSVYVGVHSGVVI